MSCLNSLLMNIMNNMKKLKVKYVDLNTGEEVTWIKPTRMWYSKRHKRIVASQKIHCGGFLSEPDCSGHYKVGVEFLIE